MSSGRSASDEVGRAKEALAAWCRANNYEGYDPFDALNSKIIQSTPLRRSRFARLAWTQLFKRLPINLRSLALVPRQRNSKGTALFALAAIADFRRTGRNEDAETANNLLDELIRSGLETRTGVAWGYNFDWQGRAFFAPRGTPTIVPTAFVVRALTEAYRAFAEEQHLQFARRACDFIINELPVSDSSEDEICWSYTPLDRSRILNASLLAAETLAEVATITKEDALNDLALRGARYVLHRQNADGTWAYGAEDFQARPDSFHTAFVLTSLARIMKTSSQARDELQAATRRGYQKWASTFFLADGWPKYYADSVYPADAHSAGAAIIAFSELRDLEPSAIEMAERVALWAIRNLQNESGFFYYQKRQTHTVRIPYMRWSQAWMHYALSTLLEITA